MRTGYTYMTVAACAALAAGPVSAQVESVQVSADITLALASVTTADHDPARDNLAGNVTLQDIGTIPAAADLTLYHVLGNGDRLLGFDTTVELPGAVRASPSDVVRYDGNAYSLEWDGSAAGVPSGARLDALSVDGAGKLLLSFDIAVALPGLTVMDEDVVLVDGASYLMFFDGSLDLVPEAANLDALHFAPDSGSIYVSFDIAGEVGGMVFSDEDLLQLDAPGGTWAMAYDGSDQHAAWNPGDLDAAFVAFVSGFIFADGFEDL
ncbi:hypothetical protein [Elongatibacter sediminis]|uniref:DUF4394 domain-containing protein n=1 Tax=Elongatibacter sediminis TaxID=3119006 RepID=A0AAW9RKD6_9GAMM